MSLQPARLSRRSALGHRAALGTVLGLVRPGRAVAQDATPDAPAVTVERDVVYGEVDGRELLLNVTRPGDRDAIRPAVLLFHGAAWTFGISGRVEYRLTGDPAGAHVWPDQLDDA